MSVDLNELDRLRAAATPGKLFMDTYHYSDGAISYDLSIGDYGDLGVIREPSNPDTPEHGNRKSLAELIVALVNAYPALAAELRELRAKVERLRSAAVAADLLSGDLRAITDLLDRLDYPFHPEHPDRDEIVHRICEMAGQLAKLRARDQRIRELAARVGTDESLIPAIPNLLDAIEETP